MTESEVGLPLRSGAARMLQLDEHAQARMRGIVRLSIATTIAESWPLGAGRRPEFAIGVTLANPGTEAPFTNYVSALVPVPEQPWGGTFVRTIADGLLFERQHDLPGIGTKLRAAQERVGPRAMMVAVTGVLGLRSGAASVGETPGILVFNYMGDGQLGSGLISPQGQVLRAALVTPPQNEQERADWGVRFENEQRVDVGGDLAHLYSLLTVGAEELALLF